MKAEHLKVGDRVIVPWSNLTGSAVITAILPPLLYLGYFTVHVAESTIPIHLPVDRDLLLYGDTPVLS